MSYSDYTRFTPNELNKYYKELQMGKTMQTNHLGGCHTYIRDINNKYLETLVSYDKIYFTMGIGENKGLKKISNTSAEEIVQWYNDNHGTNVKLKYVDRNNIIVQ